MTLNRLSLSFFIIAILVFLNIKTWGSISIEIIESNPCKYSTYSVLQDLERENVDIQIGNVSFLPEYKNLICIGSVISIKELDDRVYIVSGFNNRFYILLSHLIPIIFFLFWKKKLLSNRQLLINLFCWVSLNQFIFLFYNDLSVFNYFLIPYSVLIYAFCNVNSNES